MYTSKIISFGTSLIPFLEHDDANRALMGSSMQRQSLNLKKNETAIVGTSIEKIIGNSSFLNTVCNQSGLIKHINKKIMIMHEKIKNDKINSNTKKYLFQKIKRSKLYNFKYKIYTKRIYKINTYNDNKKEKTKKNNWNKLGLNIIEKNSTKKGLSAIGTNLLVAYMIWKGYNFEDAVIINEKIIKNDKLTSIQIKKYKTFLIKDSLGNVLE